MQATMHAVAAPRPPHIRYCGPGFNIPEGSLQGLCFSWRTLGWIPGVPGTFVSLAAKKLETPESSGHAPETSKAFPGLPRTIQGACQTLLWTCAFIATLEECCTAALSAAHPKFSLHIMPPTNLNEPVAKNSHLLRRHCVAEAANPDRGKGHASLHAILGSHLSVNWLP